MVEAYERTIGAAKRAGAMEAVRRRIEELLNDEGSHDFVVRVLRAKLETS